jgi:hypothetical protein
MRKLVPLFLLLVPVLATAQKNAVKVNLSSLAIRNYHVSYERQIAPKITFNLGVRVMPKGGLPMEETFKNLLPELFEDENLNIGAFEIGNTAITPEFRFYLSKKAMKGFYIAPYARYSSFNLAVPIKYEYTETSTGTNYKKEAIFDGKITAFSGGLMLGTQFNIAKKLVLDIWWIGGHYGSSKGDLDFKPTTPFTNDEQNAIRSTLNDFDPSPFKFENTVTANSANIKSDGPWAGLRGLGINLGFKF